MYNNQDQQNDGEIAQNNDPVPANAPAQGDGIGFQPLLPDMPNNGEAMDEVQEDGYVMLN